MTPGRAALAAVVAAALAGAAFLATRTDGVAPSSPRRAAPKAPGSAGPAPAATEPATSRPRRITPEESLRESLRIADEAVEREILRPGPGWPFDSEEDPVGTLEFPTWAETGYAGPPPGDPLALDPDADSDGEEEAAAGPRPACWLARHQSPDGSFDGARFPLLCRGADCTDPGRPGHATGDTGLALLVFLVHGETPATPRYGAVLRSGLRYLEGIQDAEGCFGRRTREGWIEDHALAALAMAEAWRRTRAPALQGPAQDGVAFLERRRDPGGAWRHGARPGPRDAETTTWALLALRSAQAGDLVVGDLAFAEAMDWIQGRRGAEVGPPDPADAAMGMVVRHLLGTGGEDPTIAAGAEVLLARLPLRPEGGDTWDPLLEYMGTLALFPVGGADWKRWNRSRIAEVGGAFLDTSGEGCLAGSVAPPPAGPRAGIGRLRATALAQLALGSCRFR